MVDERGEHGVLGPRVGRFGGKGRAVGLLLILLLLVMLMMRLAIVWHDKCVMMMHRLRLKVGVDVGLPLEDDRGRVRRTRVRGRIVFGRRMVGRLLAADEVAVGDLHVGGGHGERKGVLQPWATSGDRRGRALRLGLLREGVGGVGVRFGLGGARRSGLGRGCREIPTAVAMRVGGMGIMRREGRETGRRCPGQVLREGEGGND